ncbi:MAG: CDP-glucose 4,6-dehydratase [Verrucomicrobia bacterium]|nr:CDP-glucose 4,6-dehydratase [Verrucomicrobiota bacterium]
MLLHDIYAGKTVWVSGHTGFKGAWLATWLLELGAKVHGFALEPPTAPSLFDQIELGERIQHEIADLRDAAAVKRSIQAAQPDFVFHLGAQAIVRLSYDQPVATYMTNVIGTINVMEALRTLEKPCAAVLITTDKCYENREWLHGYREEDPLGGFDPYSSSKAAAEIAIASWRRSFFTSHPVRIASVRAGNVIGGGDWAQDRIVPDCIRALQQEQPIPVRNKVATRPWQHVLDPLSGYLWLAAVLRQPSLRPYEPRFFTSPFNFGPNLESNRTVADLVTEVLKHWPGSWADKSDTNAVHEAKFLNLAVDKAFHLLGWKPVWGFEEAVAATVAWYRQANEAAGDSPSASRQLQDLTRQQISQYHEVAADAVLPWALASSAETKL